MVKIVTIIGARPQIIKAAALSRAIRENFSSEINEIIVHTGQHYDHNMSDVFIEEMRIPQPNYNLGIGSASHGEQTAEMIKGVEIILQKEQPQWCVLFGDTNSTLAGAVAAAKMHIPVAHIEAGLRSFNKSMPEELNRIACDHFSTLLFAPTTTAVHNLKNEGFNTDASPPFHIDNPGIIHSGDIMYDNTLFFNSIAQQKTDIIQKLQLENKKFALCTIHRPYNTDNDSRLKSIFQAFIDLSLETELDFIIPLHPRTAKILKSLNDKTFVGKLEASKGVKIIEPVSFIEITALESHAQLILTDSGGVQKEAYFMKKPCVILRSETEWVEIVEHKAGVLTDADSHQIKQAVNQFMQNPPQDFPHVFGDGKAAEKICQWLIGE